MLINVETLFKSDFKTVTEQINKPEILLHVTKPLLFIIPEDGAVFPEKWKNGEYSVTMKLFGMISLGKQYIRIEKIKQSDHEFIIRDNGSGDLAEKWDHWILIQKCSGGKFVRYTDRVEIKAGLLTPFVGLFAAIFYRWRQFRWRKLIRSNFRGI